MSKQIFYISFREFKKAQKLKDYVDNTSSGSYCNHRCLRQIRKIIRYIECIQTYEYNIENSTTVKLLLLIKKNNLLQLKSISQLVYHNNLYMTETLIKKDVIFFSKWGSYHRGNNSKS